MANIQYIVTQVDTQGVVNGNTLTVEDLGIAEPFEINTNFEPIRNTLELHVYGLDGELLQSDYEYERQAFLQDSEVARDGKASTVSLDPTEDAKRLGFSSGDVNLLYNFVDDLFTEDKSKVEFFIEEISGDRKELRLLTTQLTDQQITDKVIEISNNLESTSYFSDFRLNFSDNNLVLATNIKTQPYREYTSVVVKLYQSLQQSIKVKTKLNIQEIISDSIAYNINTIIEDDEIILPKLKGPNFNVDLDESSTNPTEYLNFNELFNYPVNNTYREINSLMSEKGIELSIDYSDTNNYIHFSSAVERLRNFQYKLNLIEDYQNNIDLINGGNNIDSGISGSRNFYEGLINSIVTNFDHYDRYLYYESSSLAWPKTNSTKPYINATGSTTGSYIELRLNSASLFDNNNPHLLTNTIPTYLSDDANNERYLLFIDMLAQHFDNLWIYSKAVTDKYDADNRLDKGIPRELIEDALKNFGVKLYTSNKSTEDLFKFFTGELYNTGSEQIETFTTASNNPVSHEQYKNQVNKRIYHNLPLLLKSKGTERGVRALFNSFGIPTSYSSGSHPGLQIRYSGGVNTENLSHGYFGPATLFTSSLDKIRIDNTGSIVTGSTLSINTSIVERDNKYTDDLHSVEIGYSPSYYINDFISSSLSGQNFNIDNLIGDPREFNSNSYSNLMHSASLVLADNQAYDLQDFTRLLKFYDNVIFKMVRDFIPARANISQGIIIKPHLLERSKIKQVEVSTQQGEFLSNLEVTGSIDIGERSGSHGGVYQIGKGESSASYIETVQTPDGLASYDYHNFETAKFDGELSGSKLTLSTGELNDENPHKKEKGTQIKFNQYFIDQDTDCSITWEGEITPQTKNIRVELRLTGSGNYWTQYGWRPSTSTGSYDYIVSSSFTTGLTVLTGSISVAENIEFSKISEFTASNGPDIDGPIDITFSDYADGVLKNTQVFTNHYGFTSYANLYPEDTSTYTDVTRSIEITEQTPPSQDIEVAAIEVKTITGTENPPCDGTSDGIGTAAYFVTASWDGFTTNPSGKLVVNNTALFVALETQYYNDPDTTPGVVLSTDSISTSLPAIQPITQGGSYLVHNNSLLNNDTNKVKITSVDSNTNVQAELCSDGGGPS